METSYLPPRDRRGMGHCTNPFGRVVTEENARGLGFVDWSRVEYVLELASEGGVMKVMRACYFIGGWVVLGRPFNVPAARATIPDRREGAQ